MFVYQAHAKVGFFLYQAHHKGRGFCLVSSTTMVGFFVCVSSTHKGRGFCLCIKHN